MSHHLPFSEAPLGNPSPRWHAGLSEDLSLADQAQIAREVDALGYGGLWTPENRQRDGFVTTATWALAAPRIRVGIGVVPAPMRTPHALALASLSLQDVSAGRFILGIGSGRREVAAAQWGIDAGPPIAMMSDYLTILRGLLAGESVSHRGRTLTVANDSIGLSPRPAPPAIFVAALGEQMLHLTGRLADGVLLNWTDSARMVRARDILVDSASKAGRRATEVTVAGYIRVSVDDDEERARRAVAEQALHYILNPVYQAQFVAMGFADEVGQVVEAAKVGHRAAVEAAPATLLRQVSAFGSASSARAQFEKLAAGLDLPVVRIVPSRPGLDAIRDVIQALAP